MWEGRRWAASHLHVLLMRSDCSSTQAARAARISGAGSQGASPSAALMDVPERPRRGCPSAPADPRASQPPLQKMSRICRCCHGLSTPPDSAVYQHCCVRYERLSPEVAFIVSPFGAPAMGAVAFVPKQCYISNE